MTNSENFDLKSLKEFQKEFNDPGSDPYNLEKTLNKFNVFDVLNIVNAEIRHSNVLAWLLDPNESHNIDDQALKFFLESIRSDVDLTSLINSSSKIDAEVRKEEKVEIFHLQKARRIDISILIKSGSKRFLIIIENKIKAKDTKKQLTDYRNWAENKFKEDYEKIFIYLTPEGVEPEDKNEINDWISFSYEQILSDILNKVTPLLAEGDVKRFIKQYVDTIRRNILENSEVNKLGSNIYNNHKKAIDLIIKYKNDARTEIRSFVEKKLIKSKFILDEGSKKYIRFTTETLSEKIKFQARDWTNTNRILLYEFVLEAEALNLKLVLGYGDDADQLLSFMKQHKNIFDFRDGKESWNTKSVIETMPILKKTDYEKHYVESLEKIGKQWLTIGKKIQEIDEVFNNKWQIPFDV